MSDRAYVRDATDPQQIKRARKRVKSHDEQRAERLRAVLASPLGRAAMWDLLERAGVYRSVHHVSGSQVYYNAGRQDFGHELLADLLAADEALYLAMEAEARQRARRDAMPTDTERLSGGTDDGSDDRD